MLISDSMKVCDSFKIKQSTTLKLVSAALWLGNSHLIFCAFIFFLYLALIPTGFADSQTYKWRSDSGTIGYSDIMPAEEVNKQQTVLDSKGLPIRKIERAKTREEIAAAKKRQRLAQEQKTQRQKQQQADQNLLKSYRSESDLIRAKNAKIKSIEQSIELNQDSLSLHKNKINSLRRNVADFERASRPVPKGLMTQIKMIRDIIKSTESSISKKRLEQNNIREHYQSLLKRYRTIKQKQQTL